jgi:thiamine-monophosphate kinase
MFNELSVLKELKSRFISRSDEVVIGIGDDCAAVKTGEALTLYSSDTVVEGIHFLTSYMTYREISKKAVSASVSDIAAMGGKPNYFLSTIGIPKCTPQNLIDELLDGFEEAADEYEIELIGGNITASEQLFIDITVIGETDQDKVVKRSGACAGDLLFVTGTLGDSAKGLKLLGPGNKDRDEYLEKRHTNPTARINAGKLLGDNNIATSMIDISDGFLIDLERITVGQGTGADIFIDKLPLSKNYTDLINSDEDPFFLALSGGEDYELLFSSHESNRGKINYLKDELDVNISEVGIVTDNKRIDLYGQDNKILKYGKKGFVHL